MKRQTINLLVAGLSLIAISCNSGNDKKTENVQDTSKKETLSKNDPAATGFDITNIAVSDKELGAFPFFSLPEGLKEQSKAINRKYDMLFFPIDGKMTKIEGKVWKSDIESSGGYDSWSLPFFQKSYDEAILAAGGVKIFDEKVSNEEIERIKNEAKYFGEAGSIDYWNEPVRTYVIRRAGGDDVYIQLSGNTAGGKVQILQKEPFKQTITMIKADQIQKDLTEKGKSVLHINFDTDKATLKTDGIQAVGEIANALNADKNLKIAINGYTDNTGDEKHNLQLSKQRAETVKNELVKAGIATNRLSSEGFGQSNPIADNNSEEGKAQNRRVELIKK